jgi:hypothetical protein
VKGVHLGVAGVGFEIEEVRFKRKERKLFLAELMCGSVAFKPAELKRTLVSPMVEKQKDLGALSSSLATGPRRRTTTTATIGRGCETDPSQLTSVGTIEIALYLYGVNLHLGLGWADAD